MGCVASDTMTMNSELSAKAKRVTLQHSSGRFVGNDTSYEDLRETAEQIVLKRLKCASAEEVASHRLLEQMIRELLLTVLDERLLDRLMLEQLKANRKEVEEEEESGMQHYGSGLTVFDGGDETYAMKPGRSGPAHDRVNRLSRQGSYKNPVYNPPPIQFGESIANVNPSEKNVGCVIS